LKPIDIKCPVESQLLQFIIVGYVAAMTGLYRLAGVDMTLIVSGAVLIAAGAYPYLRR
jgi:hypothetical protein